MSFLSNVYCFRILQLLAEPHISLDVAEESRVKESTPEIELKASTPSKDSSGVLQRFRHFSDRSWSSTSSGELGALEEARGSMPSSYQEEPVSWMPSCLSLSRRGVS